MGSSRTVKRRRQRAARKRRATCGPVHPNLGLIVAQIFEETFRHDLNLIFRDGVARFNVSGPTAR